jgi:GT2 family glycosyltransferase
VSSQPADLPESQGSPSLWIQSVLYRPEPGQFDRFVQGLRAATALALNRGWFRSIKLAIGDCSPGKVLGYEQAIELGESLERYGIDEFEYLFFNDNLGSARGHNELLDRSDGDLVLIVNPDVYLCPDILLHLLTPLDDPLVGMVEARQVPVEHPKAFDHLDGTTSWASTACVLIRREVIDRVGGFDGDSFFLYCDDVDLSWRTRLAGYRVVHQPSAVVFHDKRLTSTGGMEVGAAEFYYAAEASLMMAWKYSRPDLVEAWSKELLSTGNAEHRRAVEAFRAREKKGTLPPPLDSAGTVAQFVGFNYAEHRFEVSA